MIRLAAGVVHHLRRAAPRRSVAAPPAPAATDDGARLVGEHSIVPLGTRSSATACEIQHFRATPALT
jgi:hypothetical protein